MLEHISRMLAMSDATISQMVQPQSGPRHGVAPVWARGSEGVGVSNA